MEGSETKSVEKAVKRELTIQLSGILTAIWAGMVGFQVYAKYMVHDELAMLAALGLALGSILTIAAMLWVLKLAEIVSKSPPGTTVGVKLAPPKKGEKLPREGDASGS